MVNNGQSKFKVTFKILNSAAIFVRYRWSIYILNFEMDKFLNNPVKNQEPNNEQQVDQNLSTDDHDVNEVVQDSETTKKSGNKKSSSQKNKKVASNEKFCSLYVEAESDGK